MLEEQEIIDEVNVILDDVVLKTINVPEELRENFNDIVKKIASIVIKLYCNRKNANKLLDILLNTYKCTLDDIVNKAINNTDTDELEEIDNTLTEINNGDEWINE